MDLNFYSDLSDGCGQNVDSEILDTQEYGGYSENKFPGGSDNYLTISGGAHPFLSAETFHTPSLGDEVFEIPPISLDSVSALSVGDVVSHFGELSDGSEGAGGPSSSGSLVSNLVVEANDPSFASTFVNSGSQGLEHLNLGVMSQAGGGALLSSSALELGNSNGSHFSSSSPMTIDVPLGDIGPGLLGSSQLTTINQSELGLGLGSGNMLPQSKTPDQPLSATPSPAGSLQDEDMDEFRSVLADCPVSLSSASATSQVSSHPVPTSSASPAAARRGGGKPATVASPTGSVGAKKGKKKKDPNEPQKPVSAYALFFRDTQAAIKGQNPNASFGEVSKIVASMWDSLAEEQKQVYKRKTEAAKKDYLKALAAYKANQLSQPSTEVMETSPSPSPVPMANPTPAAPSAAALQLVRASQNSLEENTITNICASNIILDVPEVTTRSRTGANKVPASVAAAPPAKTVTKIIIAKQMLQAGGQVLTVLPGGVRTLQPAVVVPGASRQPPPLQQMQNAPPPPRLQQMAPAPPPLQAKPREGSTMAGLPVSVTATPPPPLQIKIVPASLQGKEAVPIIVATTAAANSASVPSAVPTSAQSTSIVALQVVNSADLPGNPEEEVVAEVLPSEEEEMDLNESGDASSALSVCVRAGCNNPAVESKDWDKEYCSNECVATHCRDIFMAWCSIKNQSMGTVK
ncbi:TOX high mobility group box family member 4-A-like isoform X2 [Myripristis murdjan]|uniref:TOX high mobility group box family member 4-A-like isoform X2 n=1 Tax=Myripristis murdjan TaxID=586833 RepID=UPI001176386E|nr:TOX high mobility group box family member 4-A-like isoform X2 [Myripristis murdjan]